MIIENYTISIIIKENITVNRPNQLIVHPYNKHCTLKIDTGQTDFEKKTFTYSTKQEYPVLDNSYINCYMHSHAHACMHARTH